MAARDAKGHGSHDKDPVLRRLAAAVRRAPFPPTVRTDGAKQASVAARARQALLRRRGGSR